MKKNDLGASSIELTMVSTNFVKYVTNTSQSSSLYSFRSISKSTSFSIISVRNGFNVDSRYSKPFSLVKFKRNFVKVSFLRKISDDRDTCFISSSSSTWKSLSNFFVYPNTPKKDDASMLCSVEDATCAIAPAKGYSSPICSITSSGNSSLEFCILRVVKM
ncbi:hypothetical protein PGUG_02751 [Meyerozyma guilliermondii ATCC 6260]|uniref:Uncharacterized protein n=1 Tax=Meyerozyma guilliermondii (strain ATCC 6260 / CBS 566 / DSM 6381 / JCM 1539 / NBRC 10279 / NRRL Y-324) TaxID=294746 RepID=A5DHK0_PICGU|nr:uncharacterized protein PGUG_02751 [Meyerozyma guilliermondii ATCC 6260]EDK38652.2 hypothetical protein PGUG_02751 [Meyerozyma guilliermondii ATCC 6260]